MEQNAKCATGLKIKKHLGQSASLLSTLSSAPGKISVNMREVKTLPFQVGETEAERRKSSGPKVI